MIRSAGPGICNIHAAHALSTIVDKSANAQKGITAFE